MADPAAFFRTLIAGAALLSGCGGSGAGTDDAAPTGDAAEGVMCTGTVGVFPTFDKTCAVADDCIIGIHQTNCCGATTAIGLTKVEQSRFAAAEQLCMSQYPPCACPATPTVAEDGRNPIAGQSIVVECQSRKCMTTVK
jgi:hypothetical protein